jgi:hypothetical protein
VVRGSWFGAWGFWFGIWHFGFGIWISFNEAEMEMEMDISSLAENAECVICLFDDPFRIDYCGV